MKKYHLFPLIIWALIGLFGFLAYREFLQINVLAYVADQNIWSSRRFIAFLFFSAFSLLIYLSFLAPIVREKLLSFFSTFNRPAKWLKVIISFVLIILPGLIKWTLPLPANFSIGFWTEFFLIMLASFISASFFFKEDLSFWQKFLLIGSLIMAAGSAYSILYKLNSITSYPFTLYWSEGNRFFDYSSLFGSYRYIMPSGEKIKAFISWGMQLPWAIPFIFPHISIGFYRFWYQLVWILPSLLLGLAAIWPARKKPASPWVIAAFALWTYLFLDQGPIYTPLVISAIFTVIAVRQKTWLGAIIVFVISFYAHNARWTWSYAPGLWAGMLSLLNTNQPTLKKIDWPKFIKPLILGAAGYLGGQLLPAIMRTLNTEASLRLLPSGSTSTTRQPLLWDRLYPNPTFPPGILGALAWASLPVIIWLIVMAISKKWPINWIQKIAALAVSGAFLTVGIIASVKIGGGSNLHNLDMFLVTLMLLAASAIIHLIIEKPAFNGLSILLNLLLITALISPVTYSMNDGTRLSLPSKEAVNESLSAIRNKIDEYSQQGEILFMDQRQLLTFQLVKNVPLIDDYEKKYLMDQAMADNTQYFSSFYKDLRNHRFALIINEPANIIIRGSEYSFGEENDAYVNWVTKPLLCTYEPIYTSYETGVQLLIPRKTPPPDELKCEEILNP